MVFQSRRYTATLRDLGDKAPDWDVASFPLLREPVAVLHADAYCMAAKAAQPDAARDFVNYAMSVEGQADYYATVKCLKRLFAQDDNQKVLDGMTLDPLAASEIAEPGPAARAVGEV